MVREQENSKAKVLLIEDDAAEADRIREMLTEQSDVLSIALTLADCASVGLEQLCEAGTDLVLLDLGLSNGEGLDVLRSVYKKSLRTPVIVLAEETEKGLALEALAIGEEDYLLKGQFDGNLLARAIRYASARFRCAVRNERIST